MTQPALPGRDPPTRKPLLLLALLAALALCLSAEVSAVALVATLRDLSATRLASRSESAGALVETWMDDRRGVVEVLAKTPGLLELPRDHELRLLQSAAASFPGTSAITLIGPDGKQTVRSDGEALQDLSDRLYFKRAQRGEVSFEMVLRRADSTPAVVLAAPIEASGGQRWVINMAIAAAPIGDLIKASATDGGEVLLLDPLSRVVAHPDASRVWTDMSASRLVQAIGDTPRGSVTYTDEEGAMWTASHLRTRQGMRLIVQQRESDTRRQIVRGLATGGAALSLSLLALLVGTWLLSRRSPPPAPQAPTPTR